MRAGELREQIVIQADSGDDDSAGGVENITWTTVATTRAKIVPVDGAEFFENDQNRGNRTYEITIRYPKHYTFNRTNRIVWNAITLIPNVTINPDNLEKWLTFEASTETP
jgi:SPP1 family predicted phage head-tail adaptor